MCSKISLRDSQQSISAVDDVAMLKVRVENAQCFTLWRQATTEFTSNAHCMNECLRSVHISVILSPLPVRGVVRMRREKYLLFHLT